MSVNVKLNIGQFIETINSILISLSFYSIVVDPVSKFTSSWSGSNRNSNQTGFFLALTFACIQNNIFSVKNMLYLVFRIRFILIRVRILCSVAWKNGSNQPIFYNFSWSSDYPKNKFYVVLWTYNYYNAFIILTL